MCWVPARWDALWYTQIAAFGYSWDGNPLREQTVVFFPGYPLLIHVVSRFMRSHVFYAAWAVSLAAFMCAVPLLLRLARHLLPGGLPVVHAVIETGSRVVCDQVPCGRGDVGRVAR